MVVPLQVTGMVAGAPVSPDGVAQSPDAPQSGALVLRIDDSGITETGFITQPDTANTTGYPGYRILADRAFPDHRPDSVDHIDSWREGKRPDHPPATGLGSLRRSRQYRHPLTKSPPHRTTTSLAGI